MDRAYSILHVKSVQEDARVIRGIATTPTPDRVGDIVEPLGIKFSNPMPLLWQHKADKPVGTVTFSKPTKNGIEFEAKLARITEPGALKDRVDEAWQSVKEGLVRAVSIGFRSLETAFLEATGGIRFIKSEVYELSLVTIPANAEATITSIKSIDTNVRAALGIRDEGRHRPVTPGASGISTTTNPNRQEAKMNTNDKIAALETQRTERIQAWQALKDLDNKTVEQKALIKQYREAVEGLDEEIDDEKAFEKTVSNRAKPVADEQRGARASFTPVAATVKEKLEPGIAFTRLVKVKTISKMEMIPVEKVAAGMYGVNSDVYGATIKANEVVPGAVVSGNWAYDLVSQEGAAAADFLEYLRSATIVGKFGIGGVPALNGGVGFYQPYVIQTAGATAYWVGEGKTKPVTTLDFDRSTLTPLKMATISVLSNEAVRRSSPQADRVLRDELRKAIVALEDATFIDPSNSGTSNIKPASITNGAEAIVATGTGDADDIRLDIRALLKKYTDAHNPPMSGVLIMSSDNAIALGFMVNSLGQAEFPGVGMNGGSLMGFPVIVSDYVGTNIVMVNAEQIYYVEDGVMVDTSDQVSLEMRSTPTGDAITPTHVAAVSMWQNNMVAFRAEKTVNWKRARASAVAYLTSAAWGGAVPAS